MARRSARLASLSKAAKQATEAPTLPSVSEHDDNHPPADVPVENTTSNDGDPAASSPVQAPKTPSASSPIKPPMSEMHPSKVHPTMAPPSTGLRLGFTDIKPAPIRDDNLPSSIQATPSRITVPSSPFSYRVLRQIPTADLGLGPEAQRMMEELRDEAAKIKADLLAKREAERQQEESVGVRKIAKAKGKVGRFSAAHMAEFKKMDSIENHPSAFRYQPNRIMPLKAGVKRSQSNANLDEPETARSKHPTPASTAAAAAANTNPPADGNEPVATAKRARQRIEEDASSRRPVSRDGSSIPAPNSTGVGIPRSKSNLASLMTPTKASLARTASVKTASKGWMVRSPSKATPKGIPRSATTSHVASLAKEKEPMESVKSLVSRLDRVKAILRGAKTNGSKAKRTLPLPSALVSKTPGPARPQRDALPAPMTTPGRKLSKHVSFTPETQHAALAQNSPSPVKPSIPHTKVARQPLAEVHYPSLDGVMVEQPGEDGVVYPDLSARPPLPEPPAKAFKAGAAEPSVPGDFTFRSDRTISFGSAAAKSFGSSPGQASVRVVRPSILPTEHMPGSFPSSASGSSVNNNNNNSSSSNKENEAPLPRTVFLALPHGMSSKKRHRPVPDEEEEEAEQEAARRAAKKRRQEAVPEGDALVAPRLLRASAAASAASKKRPLASPRRRLPAPGPGQVASAPPGTPSPVKRKGISLSRLNMLARPKMRK
ncbi:1c22646f-a5f8-463a-b67d-0da4a6a11dd5 [Thermothielavioides terrestris]|uniref:1c22646f-a5f8-463a-b67d-0da4a6a11dd5 n=1 Tax=Thermothielavioides terrestris TaxID=2587410 RepID=A0A3S5CX10_9PEZI|nr:1c22646f-a5f8-463a-b67d-0da4a6a11dd5 [Thermothielavioides terrestris]